MPSLQRNSQNKKEPIYPVFIECSGYTLDPFWKEVFIGCGFGKCPRGLRIIDSNTISVIPAIKNGVKRIYTLPTGVKEIFTFLSTLLRKELNLRSEMDNHLEETSIHQIQSQNRELLNVEEWKDIRNKRLREKKIIDFVLRCKENYELSTIQSKSLLNKIHLGFILKTLSPLSIQYVNDRIESIVGLEWNGNSFDLCYENKVNIERCGESSKCGKMIEKYIKEHQKSQFK